MAADQGPAARKKRRSSAILSLPDRIYDGYQYRYGRKLANGARRLICSKAEADACKASGKVSANDDFTLDPKRTHHSHLSDETIDCRARFIRDLYIASRHQFRDLNLIYHDESIIHQEAAELLPFHRVKGKMMSWRIDRKFPVVQSSVEFRDTLRLDNFKNINLHNLGKTDIKFLGSNVNTFTHIVFADKHVLSRLNTSHIYIDSTDRIPLADVGGRRIISVSSLHKDYVFPAIWIVELNDNTHWCKKVVKTIKEFKNDFSPEEIYSDFDHDYWITLKSVFPEACIKGTFLAHSQILIKVAIDFGIDLNNESILNTFARIVCVSLLPASKIKAALRWIMSKMTIEEYQIFERFIDYYRDHWISGIRPENYSFFFRRKCLLKNTDLIIRHFQDSVVKSDHPTIWEFLAGVQSNQQINSSKLKQFTEKGQINWNSNKMKNFLNSKKNFKFIFKQWDGVLEGTITIKKFLKTVSKESMEFLRNLIYRGVDIPENFKLLQLFEICSDDDSEPENENEASDHQDDDEESESSSDEEMAIPDDNIERDDEDNEDEDMGSSSDEEIADASSDDRRQETDNDDSDESDTRSDYGEYF